jgi:hypothetical protein
VNDGKANSSAATVVITAATYLHVTATSPLAGAGIVALRPIITATFDNALIAETVNASTFTLSDGTNSISGTVSYSGNTATFTPASDLPISSTYTVTLTTGIMNSSGKALPGNYVWTFTTLPHYVAVSGGCVQDNSTGLIWEVKTTDGGLRDWSKKYSNYSTDFDPIGQYGASTDASGFVADVNATKLCGYSDWRLPALAELQSLVVGSSPGPTIDTAWFPNTKADIYWSSSPFDGYPGYAWGVDFYIADATGAARGSFISYVRLVRAGP